MALQSVDKEIIKILEFNASHAFEFEKYGP